MGALATPGPAAAAVLGQGAGLVGASPHAFAVVPELLTPPYHVAIAPVGSGYAASAGSPPFISSAPHVWLPALRRVVQEAPPLPPAARSALEALEAAWLRIRLVSVARAAAAELAPEERSPAAIAAANACGGAVEKARAETGTILQRHTGLLAAMRALMRMSWVSKNMSDELRLSLEEERVVIEGALEAEAGVLAGYVAAQLRVHGATRGRYVLPSTLRAALPPPPTLQIPVSTRATSPLRGAAMPPEAPSRQLAVPTGGGAGTATAAAQPLLLTVPAVATAPVGRRHVAASAVAAAAGGQQGEEKKAEEEGEFLKPQPPQPLPPQPTRAELRALAAAAEADRQAALVAIRSAAGEAPPAASAKQAKASRGGGKRGGGGQPPLAPAAVPPFSLSSMPPRLPLPPFAAPGDALEATIAAESPGALLASYVAAATAASASANPQPPAAATSALLSAAAAGVGADTNEIGERRLGEVGKGGGAAPLPPPYALRLRPHVADFGDVAADGVERRVEVLLANIVPGEGGVRWRVENMGKLGGPHGKEGNSVRVKYDGGPLAL